MSRCVIYNFSGELDEITHLFPSERLARIAAAARRAGAEPLVVDRANFDDLERFGDRFMAELGSLSFHESTANTRRAAGEEAEALLAADPAVLFVNLWHGTGFKFTLDMLAALKRRRPALRVYGVGQKVDWFTDQIFAVAGGLLDGLVTGLGFAAAQRLAAGGAPARVAGLLRPGTPRAAAARPAAIRIDDYPPPEYDPAVYPGIGAKVPVYSVCLSNQACPGRCVFCVRPSNYGRVTRAREPAAVLDELRHMARARGASRFRIEDSTPPPGALTALARAILSSELRGRVALSGFARIDMNAREDFAAVREAGVLSLFFGIESLDDGMLGRLRKGITWRGIRQTLASARRAGIRTVGSLIFPLPGETEASMAATLARLEELRPLLDAAVVLPAGVYATTEWGRNPAAHGIRLSPGYAEEALIYPIKYLVPLRRWKPLPFTYDLLGRPAEQVTFADIVDLQERFLDRVRNGLGLPGIPDYYFLLSDLLGEEPAATAKAFAAGIMERDYAGLRALCAAAMPVARRAPLCHSGRTDDAAGRPPTPRAARAGGVR